MVRVTPAPEPGWKPLLLIGLCLFASVGVLLLDPIPQDLAYHAFADRRRLAGIPNLLDVISNLPFLWVGGRGLQRLAQRRLQLDAALRPAAGLFFAGVALTAFGSAGYHLAPDNASLIWDRLPMTLAFMPLVALVLGEFVSLRLGMTLLWPLLAVGVGSVAWWGWTESLGRGDLRCYALVQFLPLLLLPLTMLLYRSRWSLAGHYWRLGGWYLLAKLLEYADRPLLALTGLVSGHTLKHLAAALGAWCLLRMLERRTLQPRVEQRGPLPMDHSDAGRGSS